MASKSPRLTRRDLPPTPAFTDGDDATRPEPEISPLNPPSAEPVELTPAAELAAVRQVSSSITASLDLPTVLDAILKIVFQLMKGAKNIHVFIYESESDRLTFGAAIRSDGRQAAPWPDPRPHGLTHTVARSGDLIAAGDMNTHPLYADAPDHWGGAIVGLPLKIGQRVVGVMNVTYPRPRTFSDSELGTLRLLADQAAIALENARLYQVEREQRELAEALLETGKMMAESLDFETVLDRLVELVRQVTPYDACTLLLADSPKDRIRVIRSRGYEQFGLEQDLQTLSLEIAVTHNLRFMAETGQPLVISDTASDPHWMNVRASTPFHSWAGAPIIIQPGDRVLFFWLDKIEAGFYQPKHVERLTIFARQAAIALRNATLFEAERRRAEQLSGLQEITRALSVLTNARESYHIMTGRLAGLIGARICLVLMYDSPSAELRAQAPAFGVSDEMLAAIRYPLSDTQRVADLQHHKVFLANSRAEMPALFDMLAGHLPVETVLAASIGRMVGMVVAANKPGGFNNDDAQLISVFASQVRALFENAELFAEMSETLSREKRLNDISRVISSTLDLPTVLSNIVRLAAELVGAHAGSLGLIAPDGKTIAFPYLYNLPDTMELQPLSKGEGIAWQMVETGESILLKDYTAHPKAIQSLVEVGVRAFIGVPVVAGDVRLGALGLFSLDPARIFGKRDLALAGSIGRQAGVAIQNARLFEAEHRRVAALTALHETALNLNAQLDLKILLRTIVDRARQLLDAGTGTLYLLDAESQTIELVVDNDPNSTLPGTRLKLGEGLSGRVAQTGEPMHVEDYPNWPGKTEAYRTLSFRSLLGVPVKWQEQVIGVITVSDARAYRFGPAEVEIVSLFADQAAAAISNARLFEESQRQTQELTGLYQTALATGSVLETEVLLSRLYEQVQKLINPDTFVVVLYYPNSEEIEIALAVENGERLPGLRLPISEGGLTGWIISNRQPLLIRDLQTDSLPVPARQITQPARSWLGVPLIARDQIIGAVSVQSFAPRAFADSHQRLLESLAGQIAVSLENARLFEATRRQLRELAVLKTIATAGTEATSLDSLIARVTEILSEAFQSDHFGVMMIDGTGQNLFTHASYQGQQGGVPMGVGVTGRVAATGQPWLVPDTTLEPAYFNVDDNTRSELCVPLKIGDQIVGVINAESVRPAAFSETDERLLITISGQLATAIEKLRLFEAEHTAREQSEALYEVARTLNASLDRERLLKMILEQLARVVEYDSASIMLLTDSTLAIVAHQGLRLEDQVLTQLKFDSSHHIFEAIESRAPVIIPDTRQDSRWDLVPGSEYIRCWLGVPLLVKDRVIGLLNLDKAQAGFYTERHARLAVAFATQAAVAIENARLYTDARNRAAELGQLYAAAQDIAASLDLNAILGQLAKHFTKTLNTTSSYMLDVDQEAGTLTVLAEYWSDEAWEDERKSDIGRQYSLPENKLFAQTVASQKIVNALADDPRLSESERNEMLAYGVKSSLLVPIIVRGQVIGQAEIWESRWERVFTPAEIRLAQTLSQSAASVMENARLYQALARDKQKLELLYQFGQDLAARLDPEQVYAAIHRATSQLMPSEAFAIALLDEPLQEIVLVYVVDRGVRSPAWRAPVSAGLSGHVISNRQPLRIDDAEQVNDIDIRHFGGPERARSLLAVPLQLGDKVIGAMTAQSYRPRAFTADDQQTLGTLAYQAAIAIENARLYAETQQRLFDQTLLYECSQALTLAHDFQSAITAIAERVVYRLGATAMCYYTYNPADDTIRVDYEYWTPGASERERKSAMGEQWSLLGFPSMTTAIQTRTIQSVRVSDPDLSSDERESLVEWGGQTVLTVPVAVHDRVFGFFEIWDSQVERDYDPVEKRLLISLATQTAIMLENARLLEETGRRAHDMALLNDITRAAVETTDLDELLQTLADRLGELFNADGCYLTLWDDSRQLAVPATAYGPLREQYPKMIVEPGEVTMTASVLKAGHTLAVEDVFNSLYISPRIAALFPAKSMLSLPLVVGDNKIGAALVSFHQPHHFAPDETALGEQAAAQIALAIAKAQLFETTRRSADELKIVSDILRSLNESPQVADVFPGIASNLKRLTDCDRASMALITEDRQTVIIVALDQPRPELNRGTRFPLAATSAADDILLGRIHTTPDLAAEAEYPVEKALYQAGYRSRINVPLHVGERVIGALNLVWPVPAGYGKANLPLVKQIADALALAIEKGRLFDETRQRDAILSALAYASEQLLKPGDLQDEVPGLLTRLGRAAEVSRVYIFENHIAPDGVLMASQRFEWVAPGQPPQIDNPRLQNIDYVARGATRWMNALQAGQPIAGLVRDLPPVERAALEPQGILSILIVPIFSGDAWWGYLGFDECARERVWLGAEIEALKSAAGTLGAAFARQYSEAAERRQRELTEALRDTAAAMSSTLNFDEVLERVLANVGRVAPHDAADIMLVNAAGAVRVVRCRGYAERGLEEWMLSLQFKLAEVFNLRRMAETGKPLTVPDVYRDSNWLDLPNARWVRSYAGAPILLKGKVIGFINLASNTPDFFTAAHAEGLQAFVDQAAVAIENAQLYNEISALYNASSQLINPGGDLRGLAEQIALSVTREFEYAHCGVLLIDETGTELRRIVRTGKLQEITLAVVPLAGPGVTALAARTGNVVYLPDVSVDPNYIPGNLETRSELVIPLRVGDKIIGVLDMQSQEPGIFDERARRIITAFAAHAALALENARLLDSLETSRQIAEDANRLKSEFLANTSHELRTPLTGIIGSLSMVLDGLCDSPEEEREFSRIAYAASQRLLTIINDVLDIAKIEAGRMDVRLQTVDLGALFKDVRSLSRVQAEEKKLSMEFLLPETMEYIVWADPDKLRQVLLNLIGNAIKFTTHGGVKVSARVVGGDDEARKMRIDVQDTGIGISLDKQGKLFQPFVQVDGSMTRSYGGTGLGLSISRRLTELMGGALELYSAGEGQGSTFMVTLPTVSQTQLKMR